MNSMFESPFVLAAIDWTEIIGFFAVLLIYGIIGAIKSLGNRNSQTESKEHDSDHVVELARKYAEQRKKQQPRTQTIQKQRSREYSDWDRRQELRRQDFAKAKDQADPVTPKTPQRQTADSFSPDFPERKQKVEITTKPVPPQDSISKINRFMQTITAPQVPATRPPQPPQKRPVPVVAEKKPKVNKKRPTKLRKSPTQTNKRPEFVGQLLRSKNQLQSAIILKEILDKPLGLRDIYE